MSINYLVHSFRSRIASHGVHPDKVLFFAVPNILSFRILSCLRFEIVEEEVDCFCVLGSHLCFLAVIEMNEVIGFSRKKSPQECHSFGEPDGADQRI